MSKYTTEVRWICEQAYNDYRNLHPELNLPDLNSATLNGIIKAGCDRIFWKNSEEDIEINYNNAFPIYDESHRIELCFKIIKHYYTREICAETFGLWKLWLNERMNEIMPYYNQLYESADIKYNPLYDVDYKRSGNKNGLGTSENNRENEKNTKNSYLENSNQKNNNESENNNLNVSSGNSDKINKFSETPQNGLTGVIDGTYLTNADVTNEENKNSSSGVETTKEHNENEVNRVGNNINNENENTSEKRIDTNNDVWEEKIEGKMAGKSYAKMIMEYRDAILNIDTMIINELKDLFFGLW